MDRRVAGGIAGIASPVVFTAFVVTSGAIVPNYDHLSQHVSELARQSGPHAWVMRLGLVIVGMLDLVLARGLARGAQSTAGRVGSGLVALLGLATVGTGVFPLEPRGAEANALARAHVGAAAAAFALDVLTPLVFARHFHLARNGRLRGFSLASAALAAILLIPVVFGWWSAQKGLAQRLFLVVPFAWTGLMGAWLLASSRGNRATD